MGMLFDEFTDTQHFVLTTKGDIMRDRTPSLAAA